MATDQDGWVSLLLPLSTAKSNELFYLSYYRSAVPANALILATYKTTNPTLLRQRSPTLLSSPIKISPSKGPEIIEPCFIDETAEVDPTAKIGPNVSIGPNVQIGYGCRVRDSIILNNTVLEVSCLFLYLDEVRN